MKVRPHALRNVVQLTRSAEHTILRVLELHEQPVTVAHEGLALEEQVLLGEALVELVQACSRLRAMLAR